MKANPYKHHLLLIPEDPALHDIAIGFATLFHNVHVDPPVRGKTKLRDQFLQEEVSKLRRFPLRFLVLVRDYDGQQTCDLQAEIPEDLRHRVFVLGPLDEAEDLRAELHLQPNTWEEIGRRLAEQCLSEEDGRWEIGQLHHLADQIRTLRINLLPTLQVAS